MKNMGSDEMRKKGGGTLTAYIYVYIFVCMCEYVATNLYVNIHIYVEVTMKEGNETFINRHAAH